GTLGGLACSGEDVGGCGLAETDDPSFEVQARTVPLGSYASVVQRIATEVNGYKVELDASGQVLINGTDFALAKGEMADLGDGASLTRVADQYTLTWPGVGPRPRLTMTETDVAVSVPPGTRTR